MHTLTMLQVAIDVGSGLLFAMVAIAGASMVAWKAGQLTTSDHAICEIAVAHSVYLETQAKLARNRAERDARSKKAEAALVARNAETRQMRHDNDDTMTDLNIERSFSVVPMRVVAVR
jgi:hypothetical protein